MHPDYEKKIEELSRYPSSGLQWWVTALTHGFMVSILFVTAAELSEISAPAAMIFMIIVLLYALMYRIPAAMRMLHDRDMPGYWFVACLPWTFILPMKLWPSMPNWLRVVVAITISVGILYARMTARRRAEEQATKALQAKTAVVRRWGFPLLPWQRRRTSDTNSIDSEQP